MLHIVYVCPKCNTEVSAPANPDTTLIANEEVEKRVVVCPKCKAGATIELACRMWNAEDRQEKKKGRRKVKPSTAPSDLPQTTDGEPLGGDPPK